MANGAKQGVRRELEALTVEMEALVKRVKQHTKLLVAEEKKEATSKKKEKGVTPKKKKTDK